jgi:hypothetical protein
VLNQPKNHTPCGEFTPRIHACGPKTLVHFVGNKINRHVVTQALDMIIGKRSVHMNKQTRNFMVVLMIVLLLAACGGAETASAPEPAATEIPTSTSEPVEDIPTAVPSDGADSEQFSKYIGLNYQSFPEGLTQVFSMLIQDKEDYSLMMVLDGADKMLWLSRMTHYDTNGSAYWIVKDVLSLSNLEAGLTLLPDGCSLNGQPDSEIFVAGRDEVIVHAWRADTALGKFEAIPTDGIRCNSDKAMPLE